MSVYYEPENHKVGMHPTDCSSPVHGAEGRSYGSVMFDGVAWCALEASKNFGIRVWSTSWTSAGDSRTGVATRGEALPADIGTWSGPATVKGLRKNDFTRNAVYDVLLSTQTAADDRTWLSFRALPDEMRGASGSVLLAQLSEGSTILTGKTATNAVVYWREV